MTILSLFANITSNTRSASAVEISYKNSNAQCHNTRTDSCRYHSLDFLHAHTKNTPQKPYLSLVAWEGSRIRRSCSHSSCDRLDVSASYFCHASPAAAACRPNQPQPCHCRKPPHTFISFSGGLQLLSVLRVNVCVCVCVFST